jgi:cytochrome b
VASAATHNPGGKASIFALAAVVVAVVVGGAFAAGWLIGRMLL